MKPVRTHRPGTPKEAEPPAALLALAEHVRDPLVSAAGITTTKDGRWALYVTVPAEASVPIPGIEQQAAGFPVVYEAAPAELPIAKPADPPGRPPSATGR